MGKVDRRWLLLTMGSVAFMPRPAGAQAPTALDVANAIGFSAADREKALKGEVVAADLPETTDKMLAQAVAMIVPAGLDKVAERISSERSLQSGAGVLAAGRLDPNAPAKALARATFGPGGAEEAKRLLGASPGSDFNLAAPEFAKVSAAGSPDAALAAYRQILAERVTAYRKGGLKGIAPYDRGGGQSANAGEDLAAMTKAEATLAKFVPALHKVLAGYPAPLPPNAKESFLWVSRSVEDRPTFVLVHRINGRGPGGLVVVEREYYVGHSYNASQTVSAAVPVARGTVIFVLSRSTTDQVAGFMSGTRHAVGRRMLRGELVSKFEALRPQLQG